MRFCCEKAFVCAQNGTIRPTFICYTLCSKDFLACVSQLFSFLSIHLVLLSIISFTFYLPSRFWHSHFAHSHNSTISNIRWGYDERKLRWLQKQKCNGPNCNSRNWKHLRNKETAIIENNIDNLPFTKGIQYNSILSRDNNNKNRCNFHPL